MEKDTTNARSLHALREEIRKAGCAQEARQSLAAKPALTINVEDAIFARLVEAQELLIVATGLFTELAEDKESWLWRHEGDILEARRALRRALDEGEARG